MGHNLIPRRASEGPPEDLKPDEQKFRYLCVLLASDIATHWYKPVYEHRVQ
jgi:hypothetical protein